MDERITTNVNKYLKPTLAVAGTTIAALLNAQSLGLAALPFTLVSNIVRNDLTGVEIIDRLKNVKPDHLNHDVFRVSKSAVKLALKATINKYNVDIKNSIYLKSKIDHVFKEIDSDKSWENLKIEDIIEYNNQHPENLSIFNILFLDELKDKFPVFNSSEFDSIFHDYFHLYFGEYLKKDHSAYISHEQSMQRMILNSVNDIRSCLDEDKITAIIKNSISQYINEIPTVNADPEVQKEFIEELKKVSSYFKEKEIIEIYKIENNKLHIENHPHIEDYGQLQALLHGKYQFKCINDLYYVDELNEETFDYLTGKLKYNQLFTKRIEELTKENCKVNYRSLYEEIEEEGESWYKTTLTYEKYQNKMISENFAGVIGEQLSQLFAIERNTEVNREIRNMNYVNQCRYVIERTLDLILFASLSQLWDDVYAKKIEISDRLPFRKYFQLRKDNITLLGFILQIYKDQQQVTNALLIADLLAIADQFDEDGDFCRIQNELHKIGDNPTLLDCYLAEKQLTAFFERLHFLANYKTISMKRIDCLKGKNMGINYLHHHNHVGLNKKANMCNEVDSPLFSYSVLLYKGTDYTNSINLCPFVIDINALDFDSSVSCIVFFYQMDRDMSCLEYQCLERGYSRKNIFRIEKIGNEKERGRNFSSSTEEMKAYNNHIIYMAFEEIEKQLFK